MGNIFKKKSLGQHFLRESSILKTIADTGDILPGDTILEIGPGEGTLTTELLSRGTRVVAVEKDDRLIPILQKKFSKEISENRFELIHADILEIETPSFMPHVSNYKLIANIPYYITGAILKKFLDSDTQPKKIVLLVQSEVAERIVAKDGKESILSISVKVYGNPEIIKKVPREAFIPPPNVDSAILTISDISKKFFDVVDEKKFFPFIRAGFKNKRKLLSSNLPFVKEKIISALQELNLDPKARAENLSTEDWRNLFVKLQS